MVREGYMTAHRAMHLYLRFDATHGAIEPGATIGGARKQEVDLQPHDWSTVGFAQSRAVQLIYFPHFAA
jgi:hypothetical protein